MNVKVDRPYFIKNMYIYMDLRNIFCRYGNSSTKAEVCEHGPVYEKNDQYFANGLFIINFISVRISSLSYSIMTLKVKVIKLTRG